jgi:hypothetical protein
MAFASASLWQSIRPEALAIEAFTGRPMQRIS